MSDSNAVHPFADDLDSSLDKHVEMGNIAATSKPVESQSESSPHPSMKNLVQKAMKSPSPNTNSMKWGHSNKHSSDTGTSIMDISAAFIRKNRLLNAVRRSRNNRSITQIAHILLARNSLRPNNRMKKYTLGEIIRRCMIVFLAFCFYFHGMYSLMSLSNNSMNRLWHTLIVFFVTSFVLFMSGTFGRLLYYNDEDEKEKIEVLRQQINSHTNLSVLEGVGTIRNFYKARTEGSGFYCNTIDRELTSILGFRLVFKVFGKEIYFVRIFYYNLNAMLLCMVWYGFDTLYYVVMEILTLNWKLYLRIYVDLVAYFIANLILLFLNQLSTQFGKYSFTLIALFSSELLYLLDRNNR